SPSADDNRPPCRSGRRPFGGRGIRASQAAVADPRSDAERAPNLRLTDRVVAGVCALLIRPTRLVRSAIVVKPATLLRLHRALKTRKYRLLFSPTARQVTGMRRSTKGHPGQNGPVAVWLLAPTPQSVARSASHETYLVDQNSGG